MGGFGDNGYPIVSVSMFGGGYVVGVEVQGVLSPPTNEPIDGVVIESFDYLYRPIDRCSVYPTGIL